MTTQPPANEPVQPPDPGTTVTDPPVTPPVTPPATVVTPPQTPADPTPPPDPTNWEESYKGLQKVVAKKDTEITEATQRLATLTEQFETLKNTSTLSAAEKAKIEGELGEAKTSLDGLTTENVGLKQKLSQSEIIMKDFSALAPLAEYIPASDDDKTFRENAEKFAASLGNYTKQEVTKVIDGAITTQPVSTEEVSTSTVSREDELWAEVGRTAGVEGLEKEYAAANDELQTILSAKDPNTELSF